MSKNQQPISEGGSGISESEDEGEWEPPPWFEEIKQRQKETKERHKEQTGHYLCRDPP